MSEEFDRLAEKVTNWGRWGAEDEKGTLNYITGDKRAAAARAVRRGACFSLAIPLGANGPQTGVAGRINPVHLMTATGADPQPSVELGGGARFTDDFIAMPLQCATQWDSLCHMYYGDQIYNGFPASSVDSQGARRDGIDKVHKEFVSRGVLLDIARLKGVELLEGTYPITTDDLEAAERAQGVRVDEGDILMVRTGLMSTWLRTGAWDAFHAAQPGLHAHTLEWLHERRVAAVAADTALVEAVASLDGYMVPFHMIGIRDMGLSLGEFWNLEDLAADCAADGVYQCLLVAQALPVTGAVGSPVNPIAMK